LTQFAVYLVLNHDADLRFVLGVLQFFAEKRSGWDTFALKSWWERKEIYQLL